jgi:hypothetical protein
MKQLIPLIFLLVCSTSAFCITADEFKKLEKSAKQGDAKAQYNLGLCYESGQGVEQDFKKFAYWIKKSKDPRRR